MLFLKIFELKIIQRIEEYEFINIPKIITLHIIEY